MIGGMDTYTYTDPDDDSLTILVEDGRATAAPFGVVALPGIITREILRLAEENAELRKIIERDGDIRRAQPVLDAALRERDRLAEEVERLKALEGAIEKQQAIFQEMLLAERARIRRAMEEWLIGDIDPHDAGIFNGRRIVSEIDRICPEES